MMKKYWLLLLAVALVSGLAHPAYGQDGCVNSPENPTAVLALVGSAGALWGAGRARLRARRTLRGSKDLK